MWSERLRYLFCTDSPRPATEMLRRDHLTLGGKIIISLTWAAKKRYLPNEGIWEKQTNRQTDKQTNKDANIFQNQIFVDSVGYIKICLIWLFLTKGYNYFVFRLKQVWSNNTMLWEYPEGRAFAASDSVRGHTTYRERETVSNHVNREALIFVFVQIHLARRARTDMAQS